MPYDFSTEIKVLHIIAGSMDGGAARGAYLLHKALLQKGVDSIVMSDTTDKPEESIHLVQREKGLKGFMWAFVRRVLNIVLRLYRRRKRHIFSTGFDGVDLTRNSLFSQADIIHLHWINGLVAVRSLREINKPVIWTMRDMWPFTGGCHYSMGCFAYQSGCGACPQLGSTNRYDLSRLVFDHKAASLPKNLYLVGISQWLSDLARRSTIFGASDIRTISNNVNTASFYPSDQAVARSALGLPPSNKIVLLGAQAPTDFYKGFDLFMAAAEAIGLQNIHFLFFGQLMDDNLRDLPFPYTNLGFIESNEVLRMVYSAADVFVAPSRMEAFGKTVAESLSCGTPVVCFDSAGPGEIVHHKVTGYKAKPFESYDLAAGIKWVLSLSTNEVQSLRKEASRRALSKYDPARIATEYTDLYAEAVRAQARAGF